jgi:hypothetical protein
LVVGSGADALYLVGFGLEQKRGVVADRVLAVSAGEDMTEVVGDVGASVIDEMLETVRAHDVDAPLEFAQQLLHLPARDLSNGKSSADVVSVLCP